MLSNDSIAVCSEKVNKKTVIISRNEVSINIFVIIFNIENIFDLNDRLEEIQVLSKYILSQNKRKIKQKKQKNL
jgi:hypothetical protein